MWFGIFRMSLAALKQNLTRSILTALGVIVGTAIVIIVLMVGAGVRSLILAQVSSITSESLWIERQIPSKGNQAEKDRNTGQGLATGVEITTLKHEDTEDLKQLGNIETGFSVVMGQSKFVSKATEKQVNFWATTPEYFEIENIPIEFGRIFSTSEEQGMQQVVVLGSNLALDLFPNSSPVDKKVKINGKGYKVVGVAEPVGLKFFMDMDDYAFLPLKTAQKKIMGIDYLHAISLRMNNSDLVKSTISQSTRILRRNHNITDPDKDDFVIRTMDEAMDIIDTITNGISLLLFGVALISMIVGGVGIMNVMYVAVTERTQEIGLKKAIGASPLAIRTQFVTEAIVICLIGGVIGTLMGIGISFLVSFIAGYFDFDWPFVFTLQPVLLALGISVMVGIIFGIAPANKAAKLNPIDALRS
jgi:putative ABC transport system permease protein